MHHSMQEPGDTALRETSLTWKDRPCGTPLPGGPWRGRSTEMEVGVGAGAGEEQGEVFSWGQTLSLGREILRMDRRDGRTCLIPLNCTFKND